MQFNTATSDGGRCQLQGLVGHCGGREVFLGFASGALLSRLSFSDVLDETTGSGYQRRFCKEHSLAFKRYIQEPGATTIPLTFNLRQGTPQRWILERAKAGTAILRLESGGPPVMAQVDCQHRLGYLRESPIPFAFMVFLGLTVEEEMRIFRDINGKAKGLSSSLLDYTGAKLAQEDLAVAHPAIALALRLQEDPDSPWHHRLDLGGDRTTGTKRIASLRTMQKAIRRFQREAGDCGADLNVVGRQLVDFWKAVVRIYPYQWMQARRHLITKGIGVYALMSMAGVLVAEARTRGRQVDQDYFVEKLSDFGDGVDWSNTGAMKGFGGAGGADRAFELLKSVRTEALRGLHGKQEHPAH
jgi:DNA sulfur modification protein DndB